MSQFVRPVQAYAAQSAPVATVASPEVTNIESLHRRITDAVSLKKGTTQYGTVQSFNTTERHLVIPDSVYSALVTAGVNFADSVRNDPAAPGTMAATSEVPGLWNPGLHKQVVFSIGDSITNSAFGAGTYPELNTLSNKLWSQSIAQESGLRGCFLTNTITQAPDRAFTGQWTHARSRLVFNFGRDSWRLANQTGFTYTTGAPWVNNLPHMSRLALHSSQQLVAVIFCGTNDIKHANDNGNPGLAAVPVGTAGASSTGTPNYIENALVPFITAFKALYPTAKVIFVTPIARVNSTLLNAKFNDIAAYAVANRIALGIDTIVDTRTIPEFDCRVPSVVTNATYYQPDEVHLRAAANVLLGASIRTALNGLL